ncbi:serine hydrolase domain-containing protein [Dyella sp. GSA-30]|uniref:serine hydrolase domain-containing protein n=1 Tax=Dyella sp. GSA-30 TaxID=2994496 RepID=UPI0024927A97|nr:serine hydrolase domain-containing protein [Dyella sp. GSA-30]BDU19260.1 hypothetical protein DYGSA30_07170 [Dyella sp. GSA-30]
MKHVRKILFGACVAYAGTATAMADDQLQHVLEQRFSGDRTGVCVEAAMIDHDHVARGAVCADPSQHDRIGARSAFEIGSVSKTMTAALLAGLILQHKASLDDPLSAWLPAGSKVPDFDGQPILLRHVVTHTSGLPGLPSRMHPADPANPYADLDDATLLASLGDVKLQQAPGAQFAYSNYAMMLLSSALARRTGTDLESLLRERLFGPLGMKHAYIAKAPEGVVPATGHYPNGTVAPAWAFSTNLAGVGGVRATLDDMIRYVQGELGQGKIDAATLAALRLTQQPVKTASGRPMAMNWMLPKLGQATMVMHEGGTGGFSSLVAFDPASQRGVVLLADTSLTNTGGLGDVALPLLDPTVPLRHPRRSVTAPPALLDALTGDYRLQNGMIMTLRHKGDALTVQVPGQPEFTMGYDSVGDFYPLKLDALLHPDGHDRFLWKQGGGAMSAERVVAPATKTP